MFDPRTTILIRQAPSLPNLDRDRLPEELTKAFAAIVAFRLRAGRAQRPVPEDLKTSLDRFRRLAATFEGLVPLPPDRPDRRSAAFVAAQAHQLLQSARRAFNPEEARYSPLRPEAISPEISALVLFLIANQASDAMEMARLATALRPEGDGPIARLIDALAALAAGRLFDISALANLPLLSFSPQSEEAAAESLYQSILAALGELSVFLTDVSAHTAERDRATLMLRNVQALSVEQEPWPFNASKHFPLPPISTFAGPHHLATLLLSTIDLLGVSALSGTPAPPGVEASRWREILRPLVARRPFLWPNHLEAIQRHFLDPGTSCVVSFPTGAGKSTLSELKIATALALRGTVVVLAPTHALVAQYTADLAVTFPNVPIRDSIIAEDFYAEIADHLWLNEPQIVVMTPERCLALISSDPKPFTSVRLVVFDECHLLHPTQVGHSRRSIDAMLALLYVHDAAPAADWLLLSAMIANADDIAGWLEDLTRRPSLALTLNWKPTRQARGCLVYDRAEINKLTQKIKHAERSATRKAGNLSKPGTALKKELLAHPYAFFCLEQTWQTTNVEDYALLRLLDDAVPLSASGNPPKDKAGRPQRQVWYLTPNKNDVASHLAAQCVRIGIKVLLFVQNTRDVGAIANEINALIGNEVAAPTFDQGENRLLETATEEVGSAAAVIVPSGAAGCHHALMLPSERELAENLFRRQEGIRALAATATLAQGMNLPADIVFIVGDERFDKQIDTFSPLEAHELLNAAGRAGRAGHVSQGAVIVLPHSIVDFDPTTNRIAAKWIQLQEAVFSRADQCLIVRDPVQMVIDRIHDTAVTQDEDLAQAEFQYFLRRIPPGTETDPDSPKRFLRSTLAAWQAKRANEENRFENEIEGILARRDEVVPRSQATTWRDELAYRTGITVELIEELDNHVSTGAARFTTTEDLVR
jgi:superfamily II DNA/RNA helicase